MITWKYKSILYTTFFEFTVPSLVYIRHNREHVTVEISVELLAQTWDEDVQDQAVNKSPSPPNSSEIESYLNDKQTNSQTYKIRN